jgi:hypothetical protein
MGASPDDGPAVINERPWAASAQIALELRR